MKNKTILISVAVVYKYPTNHGTKKEKPVWFIIGGSTEGQWELPKTTVRRGESSVRAVIRQMGEQGGMRTKVLEEVGRSAGSTTVNGRIVAQKYLYYLMVCKGDSEVLGFSQSAWLDYEKAYKRLSSKKDRAMLAKARDMAKDIQKQKNGREEFVDEEEEVILG
jgi:ADP-ribose pyrophosphatase YjhB (NUDIX family)